MKDSSLDEFLDTSDGSAEEANDDPSTVESTDSSTNADGSPAANDDSSTEGESPLDVDPATVTSRWARDGESCTACGTTASRLWNDGDRAVCSGCKDWS